MQQLCCDLQVDVNGEEVFMVDKTTLASFSGRFSKLFGNLMDDTQSLKVVFHDFPGGAEGFELVARFCYNKGRTEITPANLVLLNCAAQYLEMESDGLKPGLLTQTKKSLDGISFWTWSELLVALKECQDLLPASNSSLILDKVLDCVIGRLASPIVASPYTSSSENSSFQYCSWDTRSSYSMRNNFSQISWWFEDLLFLNIDLIDKVTKMMISQHFDHSTISKFLFCYQRSRFLGATPTEKRKITEVIINLLSLLDRSSVSCKLLFDMFRVASRLKISTKSKSILENLIGSQLDQATIDFLLVPSPLGKHYMYDVNLVLRLVKAFCNEERCCLSPMRLRKVASLLDSYLVEVAADPNLNPSKFAALVMLLSDSERQSHDTLFHAIDIYLEVHGGLCEAEKMRICSALNYAKLSTDALRHLARNSKFPSRIAIQAFINQQSKLENLLDGKKHVDTFSGSLSVDESINEKENSDQILLYAKRVNLPTKADQLDVHLQGMQCRVRELEKFCGIMQTQIGNIPRTRLSSLGNNARFLPKLCS